MPAALVATLMSLFVGLLGLFGPAAASSRLDQPAGQPHQVHGCVTGSVELGATANRVSLQDPAGVAPLVFAGSRGRRIVVQVYVHVLRTATRGGVPRSRVERQIKVLNHAFAGRESTVAANAPFRFAVSGVDVTVNRAWSRMDEGSIAERHAKRALHQGDGSDLNVYVGENEAGLLGWGTQPTRYAGHPLLDGVVISRHTMPGGAGGRYSAGDALVHETGHWLGLFHTFTHGCREPGDRVADTPAEARPSYDCHVHRDTCNAPGNDPVHNFMDYGDDACMNQFTPDQVARMLGSWQRFREPAAT